MHILMGLFMCLSLLRLKQQLVYLDPYSSFVSGYWVSHFCTNSRYAYWALRINERESWRYLCNEVTSRSPTTINQLFTLPGHIRIALIPTSLFAGLLLWTYWLIPAKACSSIRASGLWLGFRLPSGKVSATPTTIWLEATTSTASNLSPNQWI